MRSIALTLAALAAVAAAPAQALTTGDIAFTSFNADEDGWSLVTFVDIAAGTTVFFSDGTASSATAIGTGESSFQWDTGAAVIEAGTVVRFSAIDASSRAVSVGTFSVVNSSNLGLSASNETIFAFLGSSATSVTTMLTAVSSESSTTSLTTVGLTAGVNAVKLTSSTDYGQYTGARTGEQTFADYAALVNNPSNWFITTTGDNAATAPDTTAFTAVVPEPETYALFLAGIGALLSLRARRSRDRG